MAISDLSQMSDADLQGIAGQGELASPMGAPPPDLSNVPDADLAKIAAQANIQKPTFGSALGYGIADAIPFAHDIGAAVQAGETYLPKALQVDDVGNVTDNSSSFAQRMAQQKARIEAIDAANRSQYPVTSFVAPLATAAAALPISGPVDAISSGIARFAPDIGSLAANSLASGAVGAAYGASYGAGTGDSLGERLSNAGTGALAGGAGGAAAPAIARGIGQIVDAGSNLVRSFTNPEGLATEKIASAIESNRGLPTPTPNLSDADLATAQSVGQPAVVADLAGVPGGRLARTAANASPEGQAILGNLVNERYEDQGPRVADFLRNVYGSNLNAQSARDALSATAKAINTPAYRQAYADGASGVWNSDLQDMIQSPAVQTAIKGATTRAANDAVINRMPVVRNPFTTDVDGNMLLRTNPDGSQAVPTLQFWDVVKRGLDDQIGAALNSGNKATGAQLTALKNQLLSNLDTAVPSYQIARQGAFQMFGADNALEAGENFLKIAPTAQTAQMKAALASMTPMERRIFSQGLASQMAQTALNAPARRNVVAMFNSPEIADRLQLGLGPTVAPQVEAFLRREQVMDMLRTAVSGNSTTARQLGDMERAGHGVAGLIGGALSNPVAGAGAGAAAAYHEHGFDPSAIGEYAAAGALTGLMGKYVKGAHANIWRSVAEQLASPDPTKVNAAIAAIGKNPGLLNALRATEKGLTYLSASRGAGSPEQQQQPQLAPAYAKGGAVVSGSEESETDPLAVNDNPTEAQKAVGNYKKGHLRIHGLDVTIENPKGSFRTGVHDGKPWRVKMPSHYGYIRGTTGADGDHVDCFVGPDEKSDRVFVIDQKNLKTDGGAFDEHKVVLGARNRENAIGIYSSGFSNSDGAKRIMKITPMSVDDFKEWLRNGDTRAPLKKSA